MSIINDISLGLICWLLILSQIISRIEKPLLEKVFYQAILFAMAVVFVLFEAWCEENFEDEPQCQIWPFVPRYYGFNLMERIQT